MSDDDFELPVTPTSTNSSPSPTRSDASGATVKLVARMPASSATTASSSATNTTNPLPTSHTPATSSNATASTNTNAASTAPRVLSPAATVLSPLVSLSDASLLPGAGSSRASPPPAAVASSASGVHSFTPFLPTSPAPLSPDPSSVRAPTMASLLTTPGSRASGPAPPRRHAASYRQWSDVSDEALSAEAANAVWQGDTADDDKWRQLTSLAMPTPGPHPADRKRPTTGGGGGFFSSLFGGSDKPEAPPARPHAHGHESKSPVAPAPASSSSSSGFFSFLTRRKSAAPEPTLTSPAHSARAAPTLGPQAHLSQAKSAPAAGHQAPAASTPSPVAQSFYQADTRVFLSGSSALLPVEHLRTLIRACPSRYSLSVWGRVYASSLDGVSRTRFFETIGEQPCAIVVLKDMRGVVFGGFASTPFTPNPTRGYYGSGECFVFKVEQGAAASAAAAAASSASATSPTSSGLPALSVYRWRGTDDYFMITGESYIAMGGGSAYAWQLDSAFRRGTSGPCGTFESPTLTDTKTFELLEMEVWAPTHDQLDLEIEEAHSILRPQPKPLSPTPTPPPAQSPPPTQQPQHSRRKSDSRHTTAADSGQRSRRQSNSSARSHFASSHSRLPLPSRTLHHTTSETLPSIPSPCSRPVQVRSIDSYVRVRVRAPRADCDELADWARSDLEARGDPTRVTRALAAGRDDRDDDYTRPSAASASRSQPMSDAHGAAVAFSAALMQSLAPHSSLAHDSIRRAQIDREALHGLHHFLSTRNWPPVPTGDDAYAASAASAAAMASHMHSSLMPTSLLLQGQPPPLHLNGLTPQLAHFIDTTPQQTREHVSSRMPSSHRPAGGMSSSSLRDVPRSATVLSYQSSTVGTTTTTPMSTPTQPRVIKLNRTTSNVTQDVRRAETAAAPAAAAAKPESPQRHDSLSMPRSEAITRVESLPPSEPTRGLSLGTTRALCALVRARFESGLDRRTEEVLRESRLLQAEQLRLQQEADAARQAQPRASRRKRTTSEMTNTGAQKDAKKQRNASDTPGATDSAAAMPPPLPPMPSEREIVQRALTSAHMHVTPDRTPRSHAAPTSASSSANPNAVPRSSSSATAAATRPTPPAPSTHAHTYARSQLFSLPQSSHLPPRPPSPARRTSSLKPLKPRPRDPYSCGFAHPHTGARCTVSLTDGFGRFQHIRQIHHGHPCTRPPCRFIGYNASELERHTCNAAAAATTTKTKTKT